MLHDDIFSFWKWFSHNHQQLKSDGYDPAILEQLDTTISEWGLSWEIGPGKTKKNSLTISPKTDVELLQLTEKIIADAPSLYNWEYYASKQAKENWYLLNLVKERISIDASNWEYMLLKYEDGKTEILIKADNLMHYDESTKELVVEIILINLLGEKTFMQRINYFDTVDSFDNGKGATEIRHLPDHLTRINDQ